MYSYSVGRPITAVWLIGFGLVLNSLLIKRWRIWLSFSASFVLCLLPMIIRVWHAPESLTARFQSVGMFHEDASLGVALYQFAMRYLEYFSPRFLFATGDTNLRHHTGCGGVLFMFTAPLILAGLCCVVRFFRRQPYYRFLAVALMAYPVAACLTVDRMHGTRSLDGVIPWLLLAMVGAQALWRHRPAGRKLLVVIGVAGLVEGSVYFADYFGPYQTRCHASFQTGLTDALTYCFGHVGSNQTLYVSGSVGADGGAVIDTDFKNFTYAYLLFYGKIDPWTYQHGGFSKTVVRPYLEEIDQPGLLLRCNYTATKITAPEGPHISVIPNFESIPDGAKRLVEFQDGTMVYQVWDVRTTSPVGVTHNDPRIASKHAGTFRYPDPAETLYNAGVAWNAGVDLQRAGKMPEAIEQYEQALRIWPDNAEAHVNLGVILGQAGRNQEAVEHFEQAVRIKPDSAGAHNNLGLALSRLGRTQEAIGQYEQALRIKPDDPKVQYNLAWLLATSAPEEAGDPVRAVALAERACKRMDNREASYLDTLAAAYAAAGRFDDAIATAQKAIELARADGQPNLVGKIEGRLQLYQGGRAYRLSSNVTSPRSP
jgi:Flp pilus assembly protein TadD